VVNCPPAPIILLLSLLYFKESALFIFCILSQRFALGKNEEISVFFKILRKKKSPSKRRESAMRSLRIESVCVLLDVFGVRSRFFFICLVFCFRAEERQKGFFFLASSKKTFPPPSKVADFSTGRERFSRVEATLLVSTLTLSLMRGKFSTLSLSLSL